MTIHISGLAEAIRSTVKFTHVVSVVEPSLVPHLHKWKLSADRQYLAVCDDVDEEERLQGDTALPPSRQLVKQILAFSRKLTQQDTLLVHCAYGPIAQPNKLIVSHADALLKRKGRMVASLEAYQLDPHSFLAAARKSRRTRRVE
jgi:predicted protein tyrosine phosphatase